MNVHSYLSVGAIPSQISIPNTHPDRNSTTDDYTWVMTFYMFEFVIHGWPPRIQFWDNTEFVHRADDNEGEEEEVFFNHK